MTDIIKDEMLDSQIKSRRTIYKINETDYNERFFKSAVSDEEEESEEE